MLTNNVVSFKQLDPYVYGNIRVATYHSLQNSLTFP